MAPPFTLDDASAFLDALARTFRSVKADQILFSDQAKQNKITIDTMAFRANDPTSSDPAARMRAISYRLITKDLSIPTYEGQLVGERLARRLGTATPENDQRAKMLLEYLWWVTAKMEEGRGVGGKPPSVFFYRAMLEVLARHDGIKEEISRILLRW